MEKNTRWQDVQALWRANSWLYGLLGLLLGLILQPLLVALHTDAAALLRDAVPHILGGVFMVLLIDRLYLRRHSSSEIETLRVRLLQQVAGQSNQLAVRAIADMRMHGWLMGEHGMLAGVNLANADLHDIDLSGANLSEARLGAADLTGTNLAHADLTRAEMFSVRMQGAVLKHTQMNDANLFSSKLKRCVFHAASAQNVDFSYTTLEAADFEGANLHGARMLSAMLRNVNFRAAQLGSVNFTNADLMNANFEGAHFDENTLLPDASTWTPQTDLRRFTDSTHAEFWRSTSKLSPAYHQKEDDTPHEKSPRAAGLNLDWQPKPHSGGGKLLG